MRAMFKAFAISWLAMCLTSVPVWAAPETEAERSKPKADAKASQEEQKPIELFKNWEESKFVGTAGIEVRDDGTVVLNKGDDLTGVTWQGPMLTMDYEVSVEAKRLEGSDFFCGLTFPVGEDSCSFIVGGWGGTVVGLSSLDYMDAMNNETARMREFETDHWYDIRVRVTKDRIQGWIDDEKLVDAITTGRKVGIRWEVTRSKPLGIASWQTKAALRNFKQRPLTEKEIAEAKPEERRQY